MQTSRLSWNQTAAHLACAGWLVIIVWVLVSSSLFQSPDGDMYHEMALARATLEAGFVPTQDLFAYTPTRTPTVHHEWGTGVVLYLAVIASGWGGAGLLLLKYALLAVLVLLCQRCASRRCATPGVILICTPIAMAMVALGLATVRAQLFTLVFTAVLLLLLEHRSKGQVVWVSGWLLLYTVWLNLHAGFVVGVGLLLLHFAEAALRTAWSDRSLRRGLAQLAPLGLLLPCMAVLVMVNPYGLPYVSYLAEALTMSRPHIPEWQPLWQSDGLFLYATWALSVLVVAYAAWHSTGDTRGLLLLIVSAGLAFRHTRHLSIYGVVWMCYVPAMLSRTSVGLRIEAAWRREPGTALVTLLTVACIGSALAFKQHFWRLDMPTNPAATTRPFPTGAVDYLRTSGFRGNVMTPFNQGAYVSWHLYPDVKISMDSRYEVAFPEGALDETMAFYAAEADWQLTLGKYPTDVVLAPRAVAVSERLAAHPDWVAVYRDIGYSLYARSEVARNLTPLLRPDFIPPATFP